MREHRAKPWSYAGVPVSRVRPELKAGKIQVVVNCEKVHVWMLSTQWITRMHSSTMRPVRSSDRLEWEGVCPGGVCLGGGSA